MPEPTPATFPPRRAAGRGPGWYRGDLHVHSLLSYGADLTPAQLAAAARALGLDFLATTEHNTADGHAHWGPYAGDDLLVILGQEVTTHTGHWLALGLDPGQSVEWRYGVRDDAIGRHLDQVRRHGGLCVAAHPHAPYPHGTSMYPYRCFDAVEVWNGRWASDLPWNADNEATLAEWGRHLAYGLRRGDWQPAVGNSDAHLAGQLGTPHTVVHAEQLSTEAVLAGVRAGRSWVAESSTVDVTLTATTADRSVGVGERLTAEDQPITVRVQVVGVPSGTITLHTERGLVHRATLPADGSGSTAWRTNVDEAGFVRAEVRHPNRHLAALTNPIILD
ncbi:CehA/McbA family metallohydrolase [Micromonospora radicis]|uniref:Histidinol phosphatase n=1 Tax=Micromonospora radicis TaxID=1894971 RepID=A0A418N1T1_9ACTN|nr:CehA/McbA family metallohydrolase [Micromonospora radicis]RIV41537.1 histidinol phosphatase [Micromonospora radicis]